MLCSYLNLETSEIWFKITLFRVCIARSASCCIITHSESRSGSKMSVDCTQLKVIAVLLKEERFCTMLLTISELIFMEVLTLSELNFFSIGDSGFGWVA